MPLTIVMYHYVRNLSRTRYPAIKARDVVTFQRQLDHIGRYYTVVTAEQIIDAVGQGDPLPENAAWLTFDDGYSDHYSVVFPLLHARGWQGSFFPPVRAVRDGELLDVNRIHFVLAVSSDYGAVIDRIRTFVHDHQGCTAMRSFAEYWAELARPSRMDPADVVFIKQVLQQGLPEVQRNELARELFERIVAVDPSTFAAELYMTPDQLRTMIRCGMYVGGHGADHVWLDRLNSDAQVREIDSSLAFLRDIGARTNDWVMCYPYGVYNENLLRLLRSRGCAIGLTTEVAVARPGVDDPLLFPRLDTNDLPA